MAYAGGSWGMGEMASGLGALLPVIATPGFQQVQVDQYDALASGKAVGGNFERFLDGAELGYFTKDKAGYANYLAYNTLGLADQRFKALPEYVGWVEAGTFAYAVINKMHVGNNLSPVYDVATGAKNGAAAVVGLGNSFGWTDAERQAAGQSFSDNYTRLLKKWGYQGTVGPVVVPNVMRNPYFDAIGKGPVWVDKATVTYDGPDPDPNVINGRMFSAGGVTWRWGGTPRPASSPAPVPMPPAPAPTPAPAPMPPTAPVPSSGGGQVVPWVDVAVPPPVYPSDLTPGGPPTFDLSPSEPPAPVPVATPAPASSSSSGLLWLAGGGLALVLLARRKRRGGRR